MILILSTGKSYDTDEEFPGEKMTNYITGLVIMRFVSGSLVIMKMAVVASE